MYISLLLSYPKINAILHCCAENKNAAIAWYSKFLILSVVFWQKKKATLNHECSELEDELAWIFRRLFSNPSNPPTPSLGATLTGSVFYQSDSLSVIGSNLLTWLCFYLCLSWVVKLNCGALQLHGKVCLKEVMLYSGKFFIWKK